MSPLTVNVVKGKLKTRVHIDFLVSSIARVRRKLQTLSLKMAIIRMTIKDVHALSKGKSAISFLRSDFTLVLQ